MRERIEWLFSSVLQGSIWPDTVTFREMQFETGLAWVQNGADDGGCEVAPGLQAMVNEAIASMGFPGPGLHEFFGQTMAGPTIARHGSEEQRRRFLKAAFSGRDVWCQLFSEPDAGSDLASLGCVAVKDGDEWVVTGQKVWNTMAHVATRGMLLARTDPSVPKHRGISFFALDMTSPGIEVRPLRQMTGEAEFNEVFLQDVRVPDADLVGGEGEGWRVAMTTLSNERTSIGAASGESEQAGSIAEALRIWRSLTSAPSLASRDRLMRTWVRAETLRLTTARAKQMRAAGVDGPEGSVAKLMFASVNQEVYELCVDLLGMEGQVGFDYGLRRSESSGLIGPPGSARTMFLRSRANSIEGGTSEIQKNIIAERILGLPPEPKLTT